MKITVIGTGYVGLVSGTCLAESGNQVIFITVGTPMRSDGTADLDPVFQVAETIGRAMNEYKSIVIKNTVPVGTNERVRQMIAGLTKQEFLVGDPGLCGDSADGGGSRG